MRRFLSPLLLACAALVALAPGAAAQYGVPTDNPFVNVPGAAPEVYAYGLRNPFRFSFDRDTGDLTIGDVGQGAKEEIDFAPSGQGAADNYGWDCKEGTIAGPSNCNPADHVPPVLEYDNPPAASASVTGGYVVRDASLPTFDGQYLYGDFFAGDVLRTTLSAGSSTAPVDTGVDVAQLVSFGEDGAGGMHAVSLAGAVYRLQETAGALQSALVANFAAPMFVAAPPGDPRLFVVERAGRVMVRSGGTSSTFLDISSQVSTDGERGMQSMAFPPDYAASGRFYASYTDLGGDLRVDEFRRSPANADQADPASQRPVIAIEHTAQSNHNGGQVQFGPDGMLYISTGDGGGSNDPDDNAQNRATLLGKLLRLDPLGTRSPAASGSGASTPATPTSSAARRDRARPRVATRFARTQRILKQRALLGYIRSNESGGLRAGAKLDIGDTLRTLRLRTLRRTVVADRRYKLVFRLSRRARRLVRRALARRGRVRATITLTVRDDAGNATTTRRRIRARR